MELIVGVVILLIIIIIILFFVLKISNKKDGEIENNITVVSEEKTPNLFPLIQIIENNQVVPLEKNKIIDEKIKNAISTIDNVTPKSIIIDKNIKKGKRLLDDNRVYFSAIKEGTENMQAVGKTGKVYGTQMIKDKKTNRMLFDKQTEFTKEGVLVKSAGKDALVNAGFNAASMVVGQYYMAEINSKLENIENSINDISDFLDSGYQSKLMYIVSKLKEIIDNKVEILNNSVSTKKRYDEIIDLEKECTILLGQANEKLKKEIPDNEVDFKIYKSILEKISKWYTRQQVLQRLLLEIGNLRYVLACGNESSKLSHTQYNNYLEQSNSVINKLENFHAIMENKYSIDVEKSRRTDKLYNIKKNTVGKIKEEWAYQKIDEKTVRMIDIQKKSQKMDPYTNEKQDDVIKIQKYNGEYYNVLPNINNK